MMNNRTYAATVFIYGSLLPGLQNHHVVSDYILKAREGRIAGRLVDYGPYPALLRDAEALAGGNTVRGMWIDVDAAGLAGMDELEDFLGIEERNDYDRVWARDVRQTDLAGWVYVWDTPRGCPPVDGDYWPEYAAGRRIARFAHMDSQPD